MPVRRIIQLGEESLWEPSRPLTWDERADFPALEADLRDTLLAFRRSHGTGKAIAAPQIGRNVRAVFILQPGPARMLINPVVQLIPGGCSSHWEKCMSFPCLYVRTRRSDKCLVRWVDAHWTQHETEAEGEAAVTLQHECDHLDGILTLQRTEDERSFSLITPKKGRLTT